jgi:hypothetical protein
MRTERVRPLERHDLAASQAGLTAKEHGLVGLRFRSRGFYKSFVLVEIIEARGALPRAEQPDRGRHPIDHAPLYRRLQDHAQRRQHIVERALYAGGFAGVVFFSAADVDLSPTSEREKRSLRACIHTDGVML